MTDRAEGTFALLRYSLGGDRPSQTTHHTLSMLPIQEAMLEPQTFKGGISRSTPCILANTVLSLPPILHRHTQSPMQSCSKGARGLSVLPRVHCIFTAISISLSLGWRQCGHRYAIRAGRNLPDKEFRSVVVTPTCVGGSVISAALCMLPCSPDCIIRPVAGGLACSL